MNLIIIICSLVVMFYVIAESYTIITGWIAEWKLEAEEKKRLNNDLYAFKVKKVLLTAYECGLNSGLSQRMAKAMAIRYIKDVENANLLDIKYDLIKEANNGNSRKTGLRKGSH